LQERRGKRKAEDVKMLVCKRVYRKKGDK